MNIFGYIESNNHRKYLDILDEDMEVVGEVPEPSNMVWKNLFMEPWMIFRNTIIADLIIFFTLFAILSIFIVVKSNATIISAKYSTDNDCTNYKNIDTLDHFKTVALHDKEMTNNGHGLGVYVCYCKQHSSQT